jgi:hypothetical protein
VRRNEDGTWRRIEGRGKPESTQEEIRNRSGKKQTCKLNNT